MSYKIIILPKSEREIKRLGKKYRSFKADLAGLLSSRQQQPQQGEPPGKDCFKILLAIDAKNKGKSSSAQPGRRSGDQVRKNSRRDNRCLVGL